MKLCQDVGIFSAESDLIQERLWKDISYWPQIRKTLEKGSVFP